MKTIQKLLGNPLAYVYVIVVIALLVIISNKSNTIKDLRAESELTLQIFEQDVNALTNEMAIREEAIIGLNDRLARLRSESEANYNAYTELKAVSESQNKDLDAVFEILANTKQELSDTKTLLDVCVAEGQTQ